jgi:tetratricopeptide (TPR) repeat protein
MTELQLLMLGASAYFAFKIYEHVQTLEDPKQTPQNNVVQTREAFSTFNAQALIKKADDAFENEEFDKALALLNEANEKEPNNPDTLFKIGYLLQQQDNNDEALDFYKQALEFDKENEYIHNSMASIYRANGEFTSANMHLRESIALNDENPVTYYNYGNLLVDMQNFDEAKNMYKKAIELDNDFEEAKEELEKLNEK